MSSDAFSGAAGYFGQDEEHLATDVSDYVSGRLDPLAERDFERRAKTDGRLAAAVVSAKAVRRRVERRLSKPRVIWN
jgi:anti-sigma factor RsiW